MMTSFANSRQRKKNLHLYMSELKFLSFMPVDEDQVSHVEKVEQIRAGQGKIKEFPISRFSIPFTERLTKRFGEFVEKLNEENSNKVYIWTENSNRCGLFAANNIKEVNFEFPFDVNSEGIIVLLSENIEDKMLLDFYLDVNGQQMLEVELQGRCWSFIAF